MFENNKKDILSREIELSLLSLISNKLRIGIVGAGKAGYIKARHFLKQGCYVEVLSKEENSELMELKGYNLKTIIKEYDRSFIEDKHILIIAINDEEVRDIIKRDCKEMYKIYIDSSSFMDGMGAIPVQRDLDNIVIGINTRGGNPKGSMFLGEKAEVELKKYDNFIGFTTIIRNKVKDIPSIKKSVIDFIFKEDFLFFFNKGKGDTVLRMFFDLEVLNNEE
ncbi:NAD(P)-dependent oxidoreductase [Clostridium paraputrificum]|uniref:NAD(P)-dependent oxidoreductase n=1 Tax=Clostridium TaxID=1485 RepID=UPI003D330239